MSNWDTHLLSSMLISLYYGLESFDMTRSEMDKLNVPIMRAFNKIFHVFDKNSVQLCRFYCGVLSPSLELIYRKFKFLCKAQHIDNLNLFYLSAIEHVMPEWIYKWFCK